MMEPVDERVWIVALLVVGFGLTAGNAIGAYFSIKRYLSRASSRIAASDLFASEEGNGTSATGVAETVQQQLNHLTAHDAARVVTHALTAARSNYVSAGAGLILSTVASIWSVLL